MSTQQYGPYAYNMYTGYKDTSKTDTFTFCDIMPALENPNMRKRLYRDLECILRDNQLQFDAIAAIDSRGYAMAWSMADLFDAFIIWIRKPGKLPQDAVERINYNKEYGDDKLEVSKASVRPGMRVLLVDDLYATGGTMHACVDMLHSLSATVVGGIVIHDLCLDNSFPRPVPIYSVTSDSSLRQSITQFVPRAHELPSADRYQRKTATVMSTPDMYPLRDALCSLEGVKCGHVDWTRFPDNTWDFRFDPDLQGQKVYFLLSRDMDRVAEQVAVLKVLPRQVDIKELHVVIPYYSAGTMERVQIPGELASAEPMAKILSYLESCWQGTPAKVHVFDMHALPGRFYFDEHVRVQLHSGVTRMVPEIYAGVPVTICFPDEGAFKRYGAWFQANGFHTTTCVKERTNDGQRRIRLIDDIPTQHVVIVDDICHSGKTLAECARHIRTKSSIHTVDAFVMHMVAECGKYLEYVLRDGSFASLFDQIHISDSVPDIARRMCEPRHKDGGSSTSVTTHSVVPMIYSDIMGFSMNNRTTATNSTAILIDVYVASTNPVKLRAVYNHFGHMYANSPRLHVYGVSGIQSDVAEQPIGYDETERGAKNRLSNLLTALNSLSTTTTTTTTTMDRKDKQIILVALESGLIPDETGQGYQEANIVLRSHCRWDTNNMGESTLRVLSTDRSCQEYTGYVPAEYMTTNPYKETVGGKIAQIFGGSPSDWYLRFGFARSRQKTFEYLLK